MCAFVIVERMFGGGRDTMPTVEARLRVREDIEEIRKYTAYRPDRSLQYRRIIGWYREQYGRIAGRWHFQHLYCQVEEHAPYALETALE